MNARAATSNPRNDLTIYDRHAAHWWDAQHPVFASLHLRKQYCLDLLDRWLAESNLISPTAAPGRDLDGFDVVDLGCGGGLLAAPLAERGARVLGIDTSEPSLRSARAHAGPGADFVLADLRETGLAAGSADLVVIADVVEHVDDPADALREVARLLRHGGHAFVTTINRTWRSRWLAVTLAEGVGWIPRGTHDPQMFVKPSELERHATACGLHVVRWQGERVRVWRTLRDWAIHVDPGESLALGYCAWLQKPADATGGRS